jgi:hypothetical protein
MGDFNSIVWAVLIGIVVAIPILLAFRSTGRNKCWRCHVWMLPIRRRVRVMPLLPLGNCEGCGVLCFALGPRATKKKKKARSS